MVYISPPNSFTLRDSLSFFTDHKYNSSLNTIERESYQGKRTLEWKKMDIN